jgi:hypothetical protein
VYGSDSGKRRSILVRVFALLGVCAAPLDLLLILAVGELRSNYSHLSSFASLLGVPGTPYSGLISAWWFLYGVMLVLFSVALCWSMPRESRVWWVGPAMVALFGLFDGIGSAVFPCDPGCAGVTLVGRLHEVVSAVGTAALVPVPLLCWLGWRKNARWKGVQTFTWVVQVVAVLLILTLLFARVRGVAPFLDEYRGLLQRLVYVVYYVWLVPVGLKLYRHASIERTG